MFSKSVIITAVIISILGVASISALQCYTCYDPSSCYNPSLQTCTQTLANGTSAYLNAHFLNVNTSLISSKYNCLSSYIRYYGPNTTYEYKSCVYTVTDACSLSLRNPGNAFQTCGVCNKDGCNSAGHASVNMITMLSTLLLIGVAKFVLSH
ncbi:uncharacterized protein LOC119667274 [Teleopsis dalmanni]|uniref:uncharacterized protein LOC119667274 n=1 Tax=Teleopsis dalmanni TaxID=139649 RepID=UPI0018CDDC3C|nr:uncharacterized protein LOC119667274 [Teleopsis dalmanni]